MSLAVLVAQRKPLFRAMVGQKYLRTMMRDVSAAGGSWPDDIAAPAIRV